MPYIAAGATDVAGNQTDLPVLPISYEASIKLLQRIEQRQIAMERQRRLATYAAIAGAVFAAGRLGILAVPFIKRKK